MRSNGRSSSTGVNTPSSAPISTATSHWIASSGAGIAAWIPATSPNRASLNGCQRRRWDSPADHATTTAYGVGTLTWNRTPAQRGLHLCYGDYKHRHFKAPKDLGLLVRLANAVAAATPLDFIHMPVDRDNGRDPGYFAALPDLRAGGAELALGVVDYEGDPARIDALVAAASTAGVPFSVATECGMSRLGERGEAVTLEELLRQHARVASPVR